MTIAQRGARLLASCWVAAVSAAAGPAAAQTTPALEHFTVVVDAHPMALWARRPARPTRAILLIHGRTWSALPDFDLQVPGEQESVLAALAAQGIAAYALDLRGYGATPRDATGWDTPRRAAKDVDSVLAWIAARNPSLGRPALLGWSNGALVAQLAAQSQPGRLSALILYGYPWDPGDKFAKVDDSGPPLRERTTADDASSDFITAGAISADAVHAYVAAALKSDPVRSDWRAVDEFNVLDPARLRMPTLLLQGEFDPSVTHDVLATLFQHLGAARKSWVTLKGGDHAALLENTHPGFIAAIVAFLNAPPT